MNIFESISSALSGITGNKMRAALTMFGIVVGISSVIMITSVGESYKQYIGEQFEDVGLDQMTLEAYSETETIEQWDRLTDDDVNVLKGYGELSRVSGFLAVYGGSVKLLDINEARNVQINGVDNEYFYIKNVDLSHGRNIVSQDVQNESNVVMLDEDFAASVFGKTDVIGEELEIDTYSGKLKFTVIGVTQSNQESKLRMMYELPAVLYMPVTVVQGSFGQEELDSILIKAGNRDELKRISDNVIRIMEVRHENEDKYRVTIAADSIEQVNSVIGMFTLFMGFVAGISLLVGGIGVMNIMLVSVTERTREIGIRKSIGATGGNIILQFLLEAIILTVTGGVIGIIFGYGGGLLISVLVSMLTGETLVPYVSVTTILLAVGVSSFVGILFGVYPAGKAAQLDPVEALRFE